MTDAFVFNNLSPLTDAASELAPTFALEVEGTDIGEDLTAFIKEIEFEHAVDMPDEMRITLRNPGITGDPNGPPDLASHKAFAIGNEASLFVGYGTYADTFIGRVQFAKHRNKINRSPELEVIGYDRSHLMMKLGGPNLGTGVARPVPAPKEQTGEEDKQGQIWGATPHHEIITELAHRWSMIPDVDEALMGTHLAGNTETGIIQPKGMSDYHMIRALSNINGYDFWVDYSVDDSKWHLHWKKPVGVARPQRTFRYGSHDADLIDADFDYGLSASINSLMVLIWDEETGEWFDALKVEDPEGENPKFYPGGGPKASPKRRKKKRKKKVVEDELFPDLGGSDGGDDPLFGEGEEVDEEPEFDEEELKELLDSASRFRIAAAGFSFEILHRPFATPADLATFATTWFRMRQESFLIFNGTLVGTKDLRPRQIHRIIGVGAKGSGDYEFIRVRHKISMDRGLKYTTDFGAHKVIKE